MKQEKEIMKLLPIPGAPGYRVDCENQVAYRLKGYLWRINDRTKYKKVTLRIDGQPFVTTVYRMMYCAQNGIDITKLPKGTCIALRNGIVTAMTRKECGDKKFITIRQRQKSLEQWKRNTALIDSYYNGDTEPLLKELQQIEKAVTRWFTYTYGLSEQRAEIVAAYGVNRYMDRLADGFPSPYIMGSVIRHGRAENKRLAQQRECIDIGEVIEF